MKNKNLGYAALAISFIVLSVVAFVIPTEKTATFWVAYIFMLLSFAAQIQIWKSAFTKKDSLKSKFVGLPIVYVGVVYLLVEVVAFIIFTAMPTLPVWSAIVVNAIILGISGICMIAGEVGRNEIEHVEEKVQSKALFIRQLQVDVELLAAEESDDEVKSALHQLAEKIRFSDPMSNDALSDIEKEISDNIAELKCAGYKMNIIQKLNSLLDARNKKCKSVK